MSFDRHLSFQHSRFSLGSRLVLYIMLGIACLVADRYLNLVEPVRKALSVPLYPFKWLINEPKRLARLGSNYLKEQKDLVKVNQALQAQILQQQMQLSRLVTVEKELTELKRLMFLRNQRVEIAGAAEVLNTGNDPFAYKLIISNSDDQVFMAGQPVLDSGGLLGLVTQVYAHESEVTLSINKSQMVPVMIERTGERSILYGDGGGFDLRYLPQHTEIRKGDRLVTSGIDGVYPAGLPVAVVTNIQRNEGAQFLRVDCKPLGGMQQTRYVLVIQRADNFVSIPASVPYQQEAEPAS